MRQLSAKVEISWTTNDDDGIHHIQIMTECTEQEIEDVFE